MPKTHRGYAPHAAFVALAGDRAEPWRTVAGLAVAFAAGLALYQLAMAVLASLLGPSFMRELLDEATYYGDTPRAVLLSLFSYAFFGAGLAMALSGLHGRGLRSLIGPWEAALSDFLRTMLAVLALYSGLTLLLPSDLGLLRNDEMSVGLWLTLLPLSLSAIAVQAGTEELVFRGYLQQQIAARVRAWPAWVLVPSLLFGALHFAPGSAGANAVAFMIWATLFGILAADLTGRTGTLGAALGFHIGINAFALMGTALSGPGSGLALYLVPVEADAAELAQMLPVEIATLLVAWLAVRLALKV
ncbi:MAG: CPBP family intramembrane glutamic endopeptidase [Pseudomonadota bacterium]